MDSMLTFFAPALDKYTRTLLARIALDYNLNEAELVAKYMSGPLVLNKPTIKKPRVPKEGRAPCPGLTGKKTPCKNASLPGEATCHFHSGRPKVPKVIAVVQEAVCQPCAPGPIQVQVTPIQAEVSLQERLRMIVFEEEELDE